MTSVEERISRILLDTFKVRPESLRPGTTFGDLDFDSLATVEIALALADEFGIAIEEDALTHSLTITDAAELVVAAGGAP